MPSRESREARIRKRPERQRYSGSKEAPQGAEVRARNSRAYRCQALAFPADMTGRRLLKNQALFRVVRSRRGRWHREDFRVGANIRIIPTGAAIAQRLQFTRSFPSRTLSYTCALDGVRATARQSSAKGRGRRHSTLSRIDGSVVQDRLDRAALACALLLNPHRHAARSQAARCIGLRHAGSVTLHVMNTPDGTTRLLGLAVLTADRAIV